MLQRYIGLSHIMITHLVTSETKRSKDLSSLASLSPLSSPPSMSTKVFVVSSPHSLCLLGLILLGNYLKIILSTLGLPQIVKQILLWNNQNINVQRKTYVGGRHETLGDMISTIGNFLYLKEALSPLTLKIPPHILSFYIGWLI